LLWSEVAIVQILHLVMGENMSGKDKLARRDFLKQAAIVVGTAAQGVSWPGNAETQKGAKTQSKPEQAAHTSSEISYPRVFRGQQLKMIAFPLGGVGAGSLRLGGRGQLRDWEIFNRPSKGAAPTYAFPAIWVQSGNAKPIARVLEGRILPPYEGSSGLGSNNSPGYSRLQTTKFTGDYPFAKVDFEDPTFPVQVELEAFSPFIPHDPDDSGLPVAILRYRVTNPGPSSAKVSIAFSIDNPVINNRPSDAMPTEDKRRNEYKQTGKLAGLIMSNPGLSAHNPMHGTFAVAAVRDTDIRITHWRGWPQGPWWNSPLLFWDTFAADGQLAVEPDAYNTVGALSQQRTIGAGKSATFTFLLAWHFPNRTPAWCGWTAPPGKGETIIGNFYATRFKDAWDAAEYTANNLEDLERRTRLFAMAFRESTLPAVVKEAAGSNLSTLASTTCFRTADGEFHGFEGSYDTIGSCYGNCTHVWNYETATAFLFPSFARSLRKASFGYSLDDQGAIHARQPLPDGESRDGIVAADGHMGQIMHAYLDWKQTGDKEWLRMMWPLVKKAMGFCWVEGGWDPNKTGVLTGVQNNTYDVAFYGPNPMCGIYYLGALRVGEEMALALDDSVTAKQYRDLFDRGSRWIDANLFNGEFYVQQIKNLQPDQVAPVLRPGTEINSAGVPEYQMGKGCLIDQLIGQYLAEVMGLGPLVSEDHIRTTLRSIYRYNYKRTLANHNNTERTFALNDEAAMVICDYGTTTRPRIPFPYFAEVMTGFEYSTAALMLYSGMTDEGIECIHNIRARYDGEKRNPWDEAECGHHYARAMASWTSVIALSGFHYDGATAHITAVPRIPHRTFQCFWATGTGWGTFTYGTPSGRGTRFSIEVLAGKLPCHSFQITGAGLSATIGGGEQTYAHTLERRGEQTIFHLNSPMVLAEGSSLRIDMVA
jgi:non-lysosomal glucosylceramidase